MFKWRYQIVKQPQSLDGSETEFFYEIHEVHLDSDNKTITSMTTSPIHPTSYTNEEEENPSDEVMKERLIKELEMMLEDVKKYPVFIPPAEWDKNND